MLTKQLRHYSNLLDLVFVYSLLAHCIYVACGWYVGILRLLPYFVHTTFSLVLLRVLTTYWKNAFNVGVCWAVVGAYVFNLSERFIDDITTCPTSSLLVQLPGGNRTIITWSGYRDGYYNVCMRLGSNDVPISGIYRIEYA